MRQLVLTTNKEFPAFDASFDSLEKHSIKQITTFKLDNLNSWTLYSLLSASGKSFVSFTESDRILFVLLKASTSFCNVSS